MSDTPLTLPKRPSLEQLRKQAKELLRFIRNGDSSAIERLNKHKRDASDPKLTDAQFVIAREYGFESWPRLVHFVRTSEPGVLDQHLQIAEDLVAAFNSADQDAATRLNDLFHSSLDIVQIRDFISDRLLHLPDAEQRTDNFKLPDAQLVLARMYGFQDWADLVQSTNKSESELHSAPFVLSSKPPFYRIDWTNNSIEPRQPMSTKDWEILCDVVRELGLTEINSASLIADDDLKVISKLSEITSLNLDGSKRVTENGLRYLANMPQLRKLVLGGRITDRGLESLQQLRELREFAMFWQNDVTDAGVSNLRFCDQLEDVDLLGCNVGDGALSALAGKQNLKRLNTGRNVTDAGLKHLHRFRAFKTWVGAEPKFGLMSFRAEPTNLLLDGPFTRQGLVNLKGLDGLVGLSFFWHTSQLRGDDLVALDGLSNLSYLGCDGALCDDDAMKHIGMLPNLRMLMGQGTVATEKGFRALAQSRSINYFWGRECPNLDGPGFTALSKMIALKGLAVSCRFVDDKSLASLADFPALKELMPMDISDNGFRHVGRAEQLERLILMYCRDTGDVATSHLVAMPNLKKYHAGYTMITDRGLELLSQIRSLEEISFEGCKFISDEGVRYLTSLPLLRELSIGGSPRVTRAIVQAFASGVKVNYDTR